MAGAIPVGRFRRPVDRRSLETAGLRAVRGSGAEYVAMNGRVRISR